MYTISNPHAKLLEMKWRDRQKDKQREKKKVIRATRPPGWGDAEPPPPPPPPPPPAALLTAVVDSTGARTFNPNAATPSTKLTL